MWQFSSIFHPPQVIVIHYIQVENCDSNSRLVLDADDNGKFRLERVRDLVKLQKNIENRLVRQHPPPIQFFESFTKTHTQKQTHKNPSWGLTHPHTSKFFSEFWIFLNLARAFTPLWIHQWAWYFLAESKIPPNSGADP